MDDDDRSWWEEAFGRHHSVTERAVLERLEHIESRIMAALDDLNASIGNLNTAVQGAVAKLGDSNQDPGITAAAQAVQAAVDTLNAAVNPAPAVDPNAPVPPAN